MPRWNEGVSRSRVRGARREDVEHLVVGKGRMREVEEFRDLAKKADLRFEVDEVFKGKDFLGIVSLKIVH